METINIIKSSAQERRQYSRMINAFIHAFNGTNVDALESMLHPEGLFLGKYSKKKMAGVFYNMFFGKDDIEYVFFHTHVNKGIALDKIPGAEVIEIRISDKQLERTRLGDPPNKSIDERVFRFCFRFHDDMIIEIQTPTKFIEQVDSLAMLN
jgi:hypothetical protein